VVVVAVALVPVAPVVIAVPNHHERTAGEALNFETRDVGRRYRDRTERADHHAAGRYERRGIDHGSRIRAV